MSLLAEVRQFRVSQAVVRQTEKALRKAGRRGFELFVLWSGVIDGEIAHLRTPHVPEQKSYKTRDGLLVRVSGEALHELNLWLYEHHETLAVQVHSHPTDAFHSETDDTFPMVTTLGGLSIVVPDFARRGLMDIDTAVFRLTDSGWDEVPNGLRSLIAVCE